MKNILLASTLFLLTWGTLISQTIPPDSLYLGQTPPGNTPVIFELPVTGGLRPIERIAVSNDGTELYFGQLNTYPPTVLKINYYKYENNAWEGPFFLFDGQLGPALSPNDSMLFMQEIVDGYFALSYYSVRTGSGWSAPEVLFSFDQESHYSQLTSLDNYYTSTVFPEGGLKDIARVVLDPDTSLINLGPPINTSTNEGDFFIARDESFIIHARSSAANLYISYKKSDGTWTNSKSLGDKINTSVWEYGPFVTVDNKYLFFTRGGNLMSSYYTYWVKIDNIIDSLKYTNYVPYVKYPIPDQNALVGHLFTYTVPDSTFVDDDGYNTLSFHATLTNGTPLPQWLTFDSVSCTLSGTPAAVGATQIKVTATDTAGETASANLKLIVQAPVAVEKKTEGEVLIFPNPTTGKFNLVVDLPSGEMVKLVISNLFGQRLHSETFSDKTSVYLADKPKGVYLLQLYTNHEAIVRKILLK